MERLKYYVERVYPYAVALLTIVVLRKFKINFATSAKLGDVLDSCDTVIALIIGFLGAILPVILGMKNESKFVKYVFEKDANQLFLKYIKATIFWGLVALAVTMSMYLVDDFNDPQIGYWVFYVWVYLFVLFLLLTYRSLKNMLDLVFAPDIKISNLQITPKENDEVKKQAKEIFKEEK
ncbi:MAG: hypothetical protein IJJ59_02690 [Pseudobutyrivibrio sp.]|uniref:hypothetical protein n=1 Tax=Pseudobutyrivibrio sp. TaxID=2014367 RepID=UPI0025E43608|nr:hypothetical protein [Pseudobutyrivibrio sp.]MBQ6462213.1 hypothetical protein [Pseudobutyrivibrio sp.]